MSVEFTQAVRAAMSTHDMDSPATPAELWQLASEMEQAIIEHEGGFSHPDWRYVDGLRNLAIKLEQQA